MQTEQIDHLVEQYLPLVRHVVYRLAITLPSTLEREDLVGVGVLGLIRAIHTFDASRGVALKTHAYNLVRGAVIDELRRHDFLPRGRREQRRVIEQEREAFFRAHGSYPSSEQLAELTGLSEDLIDAVAAAERATRWLSLDQQAESGAHESEAPSLLGALRDASACDPLEATLARESQQVLAEAIAELPRKERLVIVLYYAEGVFLRDIAEVLEVTESRVSQLHTKALSRLRDKLRQDQRGS